MKKEEIAVKLTINNGRKVLKILKKYEKDHCTSYTSRSLLYAFEKMYMLYSTDSKVWFFSATKPKDKTLIKPKQLKELLENEPPYSSKYWDNPLWEGNPLYEVVKDDIGNKDEKYVPESNSLIQGTWTISGDKIISDPKTLEVGKWYKYQGFDHKGNDTQIMFLFNGIKGNEGKMIGFDNNGEYCDNISIYDTIVETFQEAAHQEVIEAFVYHMDTFADKK